MNRLRIQRLILLSLAFFGAWSAAQISYVHFTTSEACPKLGPLPACYVVLAGYLAMAGGGWWRSKAGFWTGWLPVFLLASVGVLAEILSDSAVCPQTAGGIPKCYVSFAVAALLGVLGWNLFNRTHLPVAE